MNTSAFPPTLSKQEMLRAWQAAAAGWHQWSPHFQRWLLPASEAALDLAGLREGARVLDVAAGDGGLGLLAAAQVGERGRVLVTDLSPNMLSYAAEAASQAGLPTLEVRVMDAEDLRLPPDSVNAVLCRAGLMLLPEPLRALREARRVLAPGGALVVLLFTTPQRNPFFSLPLQNAPAHLPVVFRLGGRGVLEDLIARAGFRCVETRILSAPLEFASAAECLAWQVHLHALLPSSTAQPAPDWDAVAAALHRYTTPAGLQLPGEVCIGVGRS